MPGKRGLEVAVFRVCDGSVVIAGVCVNGKSHIVAVKTRRLVGVACKTQMAASREVCWLDEHLDYCVRRWSGAEWALVGLTGIRDLDLDLERKGKFGE